MQKRTIAPGILNYRFPPNEGKHFGFNLYVLIDQEARTALLIDTGYEEHAAAVAEDLKIQGIELKAAVISHFHPDHILGLKALPQIETIGSPRWEETLSQYGNRDEWESYIPTRVTSEAELLRFGPFELRFQLSPGHAPCSQYTLIDERFVHVADNVMTSNEGQDILPWAEFDEIENHIASLEALRAMTGRTFLLSHGIELADEQGKSEAIDNRVRYFANVLEGKGAYSYDQATRGCACQFLHPEWLIQKE